MSTKNKNIKKALLTPEHLSSLLKKYFFKNVQRESIYNSLVFRLAKKV